MPKTVKKPKPTLDVVVGVRFAESERARLAAVTEDCSRSISSWIRAAALEKLARMGR